MDFGLYKFLDKNRENDEHIIAGKSEKDSCNGFLHCFVSPENFTSAAL